MIILDVKLNHVYGFDDFHMNFTYPKKIVGSMIEDEFLVVKYFPPGCKFHFSPSLKAVNPFSLSSSEMFLTA